MSHGRKSQLSYSVHFKNIIVSLFQEKQKLKKYLPIILHSSKHARNIPTNCTHFQKKCKNEHYLFMDPQSYIEPYLLGVRSTRMVMWKFASIERPVNT